MLRIQSLHVRPNLVKLVCCVGLLFDLLDLVYDKQDNLFRQMKFHQYGFHRNTFSCRRLYRLNNHFLLQISNLVLISVVNVIIRI